MLAATLAFSLFGMFGVAAVYAPARMAAESGIGGSGETVATTAADANQEQAASGLKADSPSGSVAVRYRGITAEGWARKFRHRTRQLQMAKAFTRRRWHPTVLYSLRLASVVYGVPYSELHAVSDCESHHYAFAQNGQYRGVFQEGPMFERGPFGRAGFDVYDPIANSLTAAYTVAREGWSQWECRP